MAAHIVLEEIGEPYEPRTGFLARPARRRRDDDPAWMAQKSEGARAGAIRRARRIGGSDNLLTELHAILFYLARTHPDARLLPADPAGEARANRMDELACQQRPRHVVRPDLACPTGLWPTSATLPPSRTRGSRTCGEHYAYIEHLLADGREWALGGDYSVVDPYLLVFYQWGGRVGLDMQGSYRPGAV